MTWIYFAGLACVAISVSGLGLAPLTAGLVAFSVVWFLMERYLP